MGCPAKKSLPPCGGVRAAGRRSASRPHSRSRR
jgi:hypothetical protein